MKVHTLKEGEPGYSDVVSGAKRFEIRPDAAGYQVGDLLMICQYINNNFTGLDIQKKVSYILTGCEGLQEGYAVLGLEDCELTVDSSNVMVKVQREGYDFLSRTMFGDCPHCGAHIVKNQSEERCQACGGLIGWSEDRFSGL